MRKPFIAGNWKMNTNLKEAIDLVSALIPKVKDTKVEILVCPPFTNLTEVSKIIKGTNIKLGAQNCSTEASGAFTGEISASMLKSVGCEYVIIGHSERRQYYNETDEIVNKKIKQALAAGLNIILCVGETLEQREKGITQKIVETQAKGSLNDIDKASMQKITIAYEPVWAIGTGKTATKEQAQEVHSLIRKLLIHLYDKKISDSIRIQYGGSVKPDNIKELMAQEDIDGALVGGASLKADSFVGIVNYQ
jgi:triosephosphate isomerase (TIM)